MVHRRILLLVLLGIVSRVGMVEAVTPMVAAGNGYSLILKSDGTLWACGNNEHGQLGDGTTRNRLYPVQIMSGIQYIAAGKYHSLILKNDGTLWAFGNNENSQLGNEVKYHKPVVFNLGPAISLVSPSDNSILTPPDLTCIWNRYAGYNPIYHLMVSTDSNFSSLVVNQSSLSDTIINPRVLTTGEQYFWRVRATSSGVTGAWSEVRTFYTDGFFPTPTAAFSAAPLEGEAPLQVSFTDQSTDNATTWQWDFGDGSTSTAQNDTHTYTTAGVYSVKLRVSNSAGTDSIVKTNYVTVHQQVIANFSSSIVAPLEVAFTDLSQGNVVSWNWHFGDGTTSTQQNPVLPTMHQEFTL